MFLSNRSTLDLDNLIKSFEVGYRTYISRVVIESIGSKEKLLEIFNEIELSSSSLINSGKYLGKLNKLKKKYNELYECMEYSYNSMNTNEINNSTEVKVLYVSELIDIIILLASPYFNCLFKNFETKDQFVYFSEVYKNVRNDLSHPASSKVSLDDTNIVIRYIKKLLDTIDDNSFWYFSKDYIKESIENLTDSIGDKINIKVNNLNEIALHHKKIIGREKELDILNKWIIGEEGSYRTANSVVAYGYGGIGKTTLVVEFINELMKKIIDKEIENNYQYILFFSSKNEYLEFMSTNGKLYIDEVRQQISSFDDFKNSLCNYLSIDNEDSIYKYMSQNEGIVVIDNIENLKDKQRLIEFIKKSPRTVQYIVTSRNEEMCEEKLNVLGFDEKNNGISFIDKYIKENNFDIFLTEEEKKKLINAAVGNTLILVTSLERIRTGNSTIENIINELNNISSYNTQQIADFMYKNTFDQTIDELKDYNVENLLRVIAVYEEPIDLYAMSELTNIQIRDIEKMCDTLTNKLVLYKTQDLYVLNDFASKFIFSKVLLGDVEIEKLYKNINSYKDNINMNLSKLEKKKREDKFFLEVINDWLPQNNTDKIAIAGVFNLYNKINGKLKDAKRKRRKDKNKIESKFISETIEYIENEFKQDESKSPHPYIRSQKARIYKIFLDTNLCDKDNRELIINRIKDNFEQAIVSVNFYYQYIKSTKSFAAFLWTYGIFLNRDINDVNYATNILKQAKEIYDKLDVIEVNYVKLCNELAKCYSDKYIKTNDKIYFDLCREACNTILNSQGKYKLQNRDKDFDYKRFRTEFNNFMK